MVLGVTNM